MATVPQLRDYQRAGIMQIAASFAENKKRVVYVAPTGAGKTTIFSSIAAGSAAKQKRVMVVVHRDELIQQVSERLLDFGIGHGIIAPGQPQTSDLVQVASVFTLDRREHVQKPHLLIVDECHHATAGSWQRVIERFNSLVLGVTATPARLDGTGLDTVFDHLIQGPTIGNLIERGYLVKPILFRVNSGADFSGVKMRGGDYLRSSLAEATDKPRITGDAISHYKKYCYGLPGVAFCVNVAHAEHVADRFNEAGIPARSIDGKMSKWERRAILNGLRNGSVWMLVSVDLVSEGFDCPELSCAFMLRRSESLTLVLQQAGRILRPAKNKTAAYLFDHVGNTFIHGHPVMDRSSIWTLAGVDKAENERQKAIQEGWQCQKCYAFNLPGSECPECGAVKEVQERKIIEVEGELEAVDEEQVKEELKQRRKREQAKARTIDSLIALAKERNYSNPVKWAHVISDIRAKKGR